MIVIFEDKKEKAMSILFKLGYPNDKSDNFIFAGGNARIEKEIRKNIDKTDFIIVLIDVVPDNECAISIYRNLLDLEQCEFKEKLFILPIICAEYYFIKSIKKLDIGRNKESIDWCISRKFYKHDSEIKSEQDLLKCKNFEKYCKFVRNLY